MSASPPPLPLYGSSKNYNAFPSGAATACLLSPLLILGLGQALKHASAALAGRNLALAVVAFGGVSCLLLLAGLILGILALLLMRPGGRASIAARSLLGLTAIGLLVALATPNYLQVRARAQARQNALADVPSAFNDLRPQSVASLTNHDNRPTSFTGPDPVRFERVEQSLGTAAENVPGDLANVLKASQAYARQLQAVLADYRDAYDALNAARVLATSNLVDRTEIAGREAVVRRFLACNAALRDFINQGSTNFRVELLAFHVTDADVADAVAGYEKPAALQRPILAAIRAQDDRTGAAMLHILALLDTNWGHWHYTTNTPRLRFEDPAVLARYNACLADIREAGQIQATAQRQLAGVLQQTASR